MRVPIAFTWRAMIGGHAKPDRIGERRQPDARREGRRLVLHVDDLRLPLAPRALNDARLDHVEHVRIAVVVVADVLLVQLHRRDGLACGVASRARHQLTTMSCPSGLIDGQRKNTVLSRIAFMSGSSARDSSSYATCGVCCDPAISDACRPPLMSTMTLAVTREAMRLGIGQPVGMREAHVDLAVADRACARFSGDEMIATVHVLPERRLADLISLTRLLAAASLLEVVDRLIVGKQFVIGADWKSEHGFGRRDRLSAIARCFALCERTAMRQEPGRTVAAVSARRQALRYIEFSSSRERATGVAEDGLVARSHQ